VALRQLSNSSERITPMEIGAGAITAPNTRVSKLWPDTKSGTTQQIIDEMRSIGGLGMLPTSIVGYANADEWRRAVGTQPPTDGTAKYWRSNAVYWSDREPLYFVFPFRDQFGNFVPLSPRASGYSEKDETFNFFGPNVQKYLHQHSKAIGEIPQLILYGISRRGAGRMSFVPGTPFDFPIAELVHDPGGPIEVRRRPDGTVWAGPSSGPNESNLRVSSPLDGDWFVRINENGLIEYCKCQGFAADDEIGGSGTPALSDHDLAQAADTILRQPGTLAEKGARIRRAARA
jgi:hypothetical protein